MSERPILFSGGMVRAIRAGLKTQTRRVLRPEAFCPDPRPIRRDFEEGMRLWVRESLCQHNHFGFPQGKIPHKNELGAWVWSYAADQCDPESVTRKRPSIHMPRWASRLTLEVTKVRLERLQDITCGGVMQPSDVVAEGCPREIAGDGDKEIQYWIELWNALNADRGFGWDANPWVWAVEFRRAA